MFSSILPYSIRGRPIKAIFSNSTTLSAGRRHFGSTIPLFNLKPVRLHTEWIEPEDSEGDGSNRMDGYTILFMHGLLGNGRNMKSFARKLVKQQSMNNGACRGGILMDLRGHGRSYQNQRNAEKYDDNNQKKATTFRDCVQDIHHTLEASHSDERMSPTQVLVGHSFGGRLALEYAANVTNATNKGSINSLKDVWLLDTVPGEANESVDKVLATITSVLEEKRVDKIYTKKDMVKVLTDPPHNMDLPTAQWLIMSYDEKSGDNFGFDNDLVTRLKPEFANQDFLGLLRKILRSNPSGCTDSDRDTKNGRTCVHMVRGGKNTGWSIPILSELERLKKEFPTTFHLHVLPSAGHNVHVDDLPGLVKLFSKT